MQGIDNSSGDHVDFMNRSNNVRRKRTETFHLGHDDFL